MDFLLCDRGKCAKLSFELLSRQSKRLLRTSSFFSKDYYDVLGISRTCSSKELKAKYLELCKKYHPDAIGNKSESERNEATKQFQEIQQAYEVLSKSSERNRYDFQQREYRSNPGSRSSASDFREQYYRRAQYYHRHEKTNYHWDPDEEMRRHQSYNARRRQWEEDIRRQGGGQQSSSGNPWGDSFKASWEQPAYGQRRSNVAVVRFCFVVMFIGALLHLFAYEQSQQQRTEAFRSMVLKARKSEESRAASRAAMQADREAFLEKWGRQQEDFERNHYKNDRS